MHYISQCAGRFGFYSSFGFDNGKIMYVHLNRSRDQMRFMLAQKWELGNSEGEVGGTGNPHRLLYVHANTLFFFFVGLKDKRAQGGGGMTQTGQTGRQPEEGGKWREKEGKESKKELQCLVLI